MTDTQRAFQGGSGSSGSHGGADSSGSMAEQGTQEAMADQGARPPWPWHRYSARPFQLGPYSPPKKILGGN